MSERAVVIDLYSGRGGVGHALNTLEYDHVGIDIDDYADDYPGEFIQGDASNVSWVADVTEPYRERAETVILWASPPCQRWSPLANVNAARYDWDDGEIERRYPGFGELHIREVLEALDSDHYIIENVPRCPELVDPTRINGLAFGLPFEMMRAFETSFDAPDAVGTGSPELTISSNDVVESYQREEIAKAKGVPTDWPEQSVHSAIPSEYVEYLLGHCPAVPTTLPDSLRQRQIGQFFA